MHPMGLCGAPQMDLCESVCLCERILSSQQPDVCRAIPLHNYLRTSGTYKHSEWDPTLSLLLCPLLSPYCPLSSVYFFLFVLFGCIALSLSHIHAYSYCCIILTTSYKHAYIHFPHPVQLSCLNIYNLLLFFSSVPAVGHLLLTHPQLLFLCCAYLSFLLTLVNTPPPPSAQNNSKSLFAIQILFFKRLSPGVCVFCTSTASCKWLYAQ